MCQQLSVYFLHKTVPYVFISALSTTMSPSQAEKTLTAQEDEIRRQRLRAEIIRHRLRAEISRQRLMAVQTEDLDRQRIEKIRTADDEEQSAYVEGKKQFEGDKAGECKSLFLFLFFFEKDLCLSSLIALAPVTERVTNSHSTKDASNPGRIKTISTTDSHVTSPYVYLGTARLRHVDDLNKDGMPSKKVDAVMMLRRTCLIVSNRNTCANVSSAAAAAGSTGNAGSADAFDLSLERWVHTKPFPPPCLLSTFTSSS